MTDALSSWGLADPVLVRASANEVYRCRLDGRDVYLRLTTAEHRSYEEIVAEIDWMRSLAEAGVRVARPILSRQDRLVERAGDRFAICLEAAPGRMADKRRDYTPAIAAQWATLLADLHRHARRYQPPGPERRPHWRRDRVLEVALACSTGETERAERRVRELVTWMEGLDATPDTFGLTHADLHVGNLSVDGESVTAIDFDDACYHWFAHDLAVAITSIRKAAWEHPDAVDARAIEPAFLGAYARTGVLDARQLSMVERLVEYRIALSACWAGRSFQTGALDDEMVAWYRRSLPWWLSQLKLA